MNGSKGEQVYEPVANLSQAIFEAEDLAHDFKFIVYGEGEGWKRLYTEISRAFGQEHQAQKAQKAQKRRKSK